MCGIVAVQGLQACEFGVKTLNELSNRGYDSCGYICKGSNVKIEKKMGSPETLGVIPQQTIFLGHTRWATHGKPSLENTHPHVIGTLSLVHNGTINNYTEIAAGLSYLPYGESDTEIALALISDLSKNMSVLDALKQACQVFQGTWAFVLFDQHRFYYARNSSPLCAYKTEGKIGFISEAQALPEGKYKIIEIQDNSVGYLDLDQGELVFDHHILRFTLASDFDSRILNLPDCLPVEYDSGHDFLKEIFQQHSLPEIKATSTGPCIPNHPLLVIACGSSLHACLFCQKYLEKRFTQVVILDGTCCEDYLHRNNFENWNLLVVSQSGETMELFKAMQTLRNFKISITNVRNSLIARNSDRQYYLQIGREKAVAASKSFLAQILTMIHLGDPQTRNLLPKEEQLRLLRDYYHKTHSLALRLHQFPSHFILGTENCLALAKEAALKIKEIAGIHSEAYAIGALKHGPFALLGPGFPVIILAFTDVKTSLREIQARDAPVFIIGDHADADCQINSTDLQGYVEMIYCLQLLSYHLCRMRNLNPDKPKNLAKVVTVM